MKNPNILDPDRLTSSNIIKQLLSIGCERLSDESVCYYLDGGCFYFNAYGNYLTVTQCEFKMQHEGEGIMIMHRCLIDRIKSLGDLLSNFQRTVKFVALLKLTENI